MIVDRDWGRAVVDQAADGSIQASLENEHLFCQYGLVDCGTEEGFETAIRRFIIKEFGEDQAQAPGGDIGSRIDCAAWRGGLGKAYRSAETADSITLHLEWTPVKSTIARQEVTILKGKPWVKIDYLDWFVNIVDIAHPGGTKQGMFQVYGAENWRRDYAFHPEIYFSRHPANVGYENITEIEDPTPLSYRGWFIMGVFNPANGRGYGRCAPAETIDCFNLLFKESKLGRCGFELFPCWDRPHIPFTGYLFPVTGGAEDVLVRGKRIVDDHLAANAGGG